jgi:hypothetical protein
MKSFSNGNFGFYENLHKKYFEKAKDVKSTGPSKNKDDDKSDKEDIFALTSKTGTILGLSQLKQSIDSLKTSSRMLDHPQKSVTLRSSSLKPDTSKSNLDKENQKTMSINFKNSLFKKINTTSVFMDD